MNIKESFMYGGTSNDWLGRILKPDMIDFQEGDGCLIFFSN